MESKRGVKRVRGWQLEKEQQEGPCPKDLPAEEDCNPLCTKLIELWSQGKLSASQVAEVSHLTFLNGAESAEIMDLAKLALVNPRATATEICCHCVASTCSCQTPISSRSLSRTLRHRSQALQTWQFCCHT